MRIRLRHAPTLALLLLASCTPSIEQSTTRAEAAADRAKRSATIAEQSADQAFKTSVRALITADQADKDYQRAGDVVTRLEGGSVAHGDLLVKPTEGSPPFWCLMDPPIAQGCPDCSATVNWDAPRSDFEVDEIFDSKSDCRDELQKFHRDLVRDERRKRRNFPRVVQKPPPFRWFCAACANEGEDDED
jgi:hypothetical protein